MRVTILATAVCFLLGCEHSPPFITHQEPDGPFQEGLPLQLSFSRGCDMLGGISASGRAVTYDFTVDEVASEYPGVCPIDDRCVGILPISGGRRIESVCHPGHPRPDTHHVATAAALATDGSLLWAQTAGFSGSPVASSGSIMLRRPGQPARQVLPMLTLFPEADFLLRHISGIWWSGPDEAVITDSAGAIVLTINETSRGTVRRIPGVLGLLRPGVDPLARRIAWLDEGAVLRVGAFEGGHPEEWGAVPRHPDWVVHRITGLGFHGSTALVGHYGIRVTDDDLAVEVQLVLMRSGRPPVVVLQNGGEELYWSSAIAFDERTAIIELVDVIPPAPFRLDVNLVRIELPVPGE